MADVVGLQFMKGGGVYYYLPLDKPLKTGTLCVVEAEHGLYVAKVIHAQLQIQDRFLQGNLPRILRVATPRDNEQMKTNERREKEAYRLCRKKVKEKKLAMKLVDVTYTLDGRKAVFYFTAENRIDFRELVKELAQALKVKIEMRQIGVRDETRRLGGVGCCGRTLCCCSFLHDFVSVSIRMAKDQNLSLNPTKVSGLCGRLMCCLAYEYEGPNRDKKKKKDEKPEKPGSECLAEPQAGAESVACAGCNGSCEAKGAAEKAPQVVSVAVPAPVSAPAAVSAEAPTTTPVSAPLPVGAPTPKSAAVPAGPRPGSGNPAENRNARRRHRHRRFRGPNSNANPGSNVNPNPSHPNPPAPPKRQVP
jgi:cell fate regulator YaaT (PSP1 superfamily)